MNTGILRTSMLMHSLTFTNADSPHCLHKEAHHSRWELRPLNERGRHVCTVTWWPEAVTDVTMHSCHNSTGITSLGWYCRLLNSEDLAHILTGSGQLHPMMWHPEVFRIPLDETEMKRVPQTRCTEEGQTLLRDKLTCGLDIVLFLWPANCKRNHCWWMMMMMIFWGLAPCRLVGRCQHSGETYYRHLEDWN
jgi:hypothetical protein